MGDNPARETLAIITYANSESWWCTALHADGSGRYTDFHGSCILGYVSGAPLPKRGDQVTLIWSDETKSRLLSVRLES